MDTLRSSEPRFTSHNDDPTNSEGSGRDRSHQEDTDRATHRNSRNGPTPTNSDRCGHHDDDPHLWSVSEVEHWLRDRPHLGSRCAELFAEHQISGDVLLSLGEEDLRRAPLELKVLGDIKRLSRAIEELRSRWHRGPVAPAITSDRSVGGARGGTGGVDQLDGLGDDLAATSGSSQPPKPEVFKTVIAFVYVFTVFLITSFVMTIVHDRVPDMNKYPPLPDIFLDNVPYIPWAFEASEFTITLLSSTFFIIVAFHKHRLVVLRRFFALMGTVFVLRCVTMLITSLSVPGQHLECSPKQFSTLWGKVQRAVIIWRGLGMSVAGVRICGDYMFSGHTVCLTMFTSFITEYTPPKFYYLHTVSWVLTAFGVFFILAGHEHYSIDVFVALYLTSRLFMYYHTLARSHVLLNRNRLKTQIWFPMFAYLESNCHGELPHEYEFVLAPVYRWMCRKLRTEETVGGSKVQKKVK